MPWDLFKDPPGECFNHFGKLFGISDMASVALPAQRNGLDPWKDICHRGDHFLVEVRAPLSAHHRDGQVQPGVGIKAYPESFHGFQVVDLARNEPAVGGNQRSQRPGRARQKARPTSDHLREHPNGCARLA
jgi:hypothetical protein